MGCGHCHWPLPQNQCALVSVVTGEQVEEGHEPSTALEPALLHCRFAPQNKVLGHGAGRESVPGAAFVQGSPKLHGTPSLPSFALCLHPLNLIPLKAHQGQISFSQPQGCH